MGKRTDFVLGVLNGAVGDHLVKTGNALALPMSLFKGGAALTPQREELKRALQDASPKVVVLVHGLMCTESIWDFPAGGDYGTRLQADAGWTPLYVRYNSGLPIADTGAALSQLLGALVREYPVPLQEILLLGYSMGGLVVRSACHVAATLGLPWLGLVKRSVYVGTPHHGAPMERAGRLLSRILTAVDDPYTRLIAQVVDLRSDGVRDLGDADLTHEHRKDARTRLSLRSAQHPVPLLPHIKHHLVAGALSRDPVLNALFGDTVVPLTSATGIQVTPAPLPADQVEVIHGITHMGLAHDERVYQVLKQWVTAEA